MLRFHTVLLVLCLVVATLGCKKKEMLPPMAPGGGGSFTTNVTSHDDDGGNETPVKHPGDAAVDAATGVVTTGTLAIECQNVDPAQFIAGDNTGSGMLFNGVRTPNDFTVTNVVGTWDDRCIDPTIIIDLTDGKCPLQGGHKLEFEISAKAINGDPGAGTLPLIVAGQNVLSPEPDDKGIKVRYWRPMGEMLMPTGIWGSCNGDPGTIEFSDLPATTAGTRLQATFELSLAECDGSTNDDETVQGSFSVLLRRGLEDVCPTK